MTKSPGNTPKPALLVDVDGVISLFGWASDDRPAGPGLMVEGIPHFLSQAAAGHLHALAGAFELVWCTGWEEKANEYLVEALGLPEKLACVQLSGHADAGAHWKLAGIDAWAGPDRPVAWIDDAHTEACHDWARERPGPTLLVATDPATGITEDHVRELLSWAHALGARAARTPSCPTGPGARKGRTALRKRSS